MTSLPKKRTHSKSDKLYFKVKMGKVHALQKKFNRMYKRKMAPPRLPKDVADSLKERGYNVSRATSMKDFYAKLGLSSNPNDSAQIGFNDKLGHVQKEIKENRPVLPKKRSNRRDSFR